MNDSLWLTASLGLPHPITNPPSHHHSLPAYLRSRYFLTTPRTVTVAGFSSSQTTQVSAYTSADSHCWVHHSPCLVGRSQLTHVALQCYRLEFNFRHKEIHLATRSSRYMPRTSRSRCSWCWLARCTDQDGWQDQQDGTSMGCTLSTTDSHRLHLRLPAATTYCCMLVVSWPAHAGSGPATSNHFKRLQVCSTGPPGNPPDTDCTD